jgi:hypothetical protein
MTIIAELGTTYSEETSGRGSQRSQSIKNVLGKEENLSEEQKLNLYISNFQKIIMKQIDSMIQLLGFSKNLRFYFKEIWRKFVKKNMIKNGIEKMKLFSSWHCLVFCYLCCLLTKEDVFLVDLKRLFSNEVIPYQKSLDILSDKDVVNCLLPKTFYEFFSRSLPHCDVIWKEIGNISKQLDIKIPNTNCRSFLYKIYADCLLFPSLVK